MSIVLPEPIAAYYTADRTSHAALAQCFTPDAVVKDEGQTYVGHEAIADWKADASTRYTYSSTPTALDEIDGNTVVTCYLVGNFPGSPIDLRYFFRVEDDKIAALEIIP